MATRIIVHNITKNKDELIKDAKYDEGEIYSNAEFAKKMLSLRVGSSFKWTDDDEDLLIEKVEI